MHQLKDVFVISEKDDEDKNQWVRIGVAFVNRDASLNVVLDAIPLSGRLHIRDRRPPKTESYKGEQNEKTNTRPVSGGHGYHRVNTQFRHEREGSRGRD